MAVMTYIVKRGDTLWSIATNYSSSIAGSTIDAKIDTLVKLNNIKNSYLIYVGQVLKLSERGSSSSSESATVTNKPIVSGFGLQADDTSGRAMFASWDWKKNGSLASSTKGFTVRWKQYLYGKWISTDSNIEYPDTATDPEFLHDYSKPQFQYSTYSADSAATKVAFQVIPFYKEDNTIKYWSYSVAGWSDEKQYDFSDNPPLVPPVPSVKIEGTTLTASIDNIDANELSATGVKFNIVANNESSYDTSGEVKINTEANYVSYQRYVRNGSEYKVRACAVSAKGKVSGWSDFSDNQGTVPARPIVGIFSITQNKREDGTIYAYLRWNRQSNVTGYIIEYISTQYVTDKSHFDDIPERIEKKTVDDPGSKYETTVGAVIEGIDPGYKYFFRLRAVNDVGESDPSSITTMPIGEPPAAPTTWSSSNSAFVGELMELNWTHNSRDGSSQSYAQLSLKINDDDWVSYTFKNTTNSTTGEQMDVETFTYGEAVSYKGNLYFKMNTSQASLKNAKIQWKVRTAGITDKFSDTDWSVERTIYIYEKPTLLLSVVTDLASFGGTIVEALPSFPFYIKARVDLDSYEVQKPVGYRLMIKAHNFYETIDNAGRTKTINAGDAIYSKYFDTSGTSYDLIVEMSADNIDLESGMQYTVYCAADMSTGLSVDQSYDFSVNWADVEYSIDATIDIDHDSLIAMITPRCIDTDGNLVENIELSVYRREYDGTLIEIATKIPNNATSVSDPHPSLDYARYRIVAKEMLTGAISFYDMPGYPVNSHAVVIQWDEDWSTFNANDVQSIEAPDWSGSMLKLTYNIDVTDQRKREVELVRYAGREHPVSYYGTQREESPSWKVEIPAYDKETIYALRRLSLWAGDVYIREPSGMGYWANVNVSFSQTHKEVTIPVTINITRVEGGM